MPTTDRELPQVVVNKLTQAQYNSATKSQDEFYLVTDAKMDTADIADGAITSAKIDWSTTPQSYSTSEVNTGATWIDGKPIYKKTIDMGALPAGGTTTTSDVSSLNIETLVDCRGMAWNPTSRNFRPLPFVGDSMDNMLRVDVQNVSDVHTLRIISTTGGAWTGYTKSYVTLWYTKATN